MDVFFLRCNMIIKMVSLIWFSLCLQNLGSALRATGWSSESVPCLLPSNRYGKEQDTARLSMGAAKCSFRSGPTWQNGRPQFPQQNGTPHGCTDRPEKCQYLIETFSSAFQYKSFFSHLKGTDLIFNYFYIYNYNRYPESPGYFIFRKLVAQMWPHISAW